ncbi:MAG: hypothetical protein MUC52_02635 [Candidatus Omnitrophica bacterium]|jgi:hypothetical protein|nr:hypothetical protein [Candidatus Omnitrophota bacterium]
MKNKCGLLAVGVWVLLLAVSFCASSFGYDGWQEYSNDEQGYSLDLPADVQTVFKKMRDREEAAQNLLPFDYVNFSMKQSGQGQEPFELGLGVHWNKFKLSTRKFADLKDEGVKSGVKQYVTHRSSAVTVAGIEGVRDDFALEKEYGWTTYSRVIIPYNDKFFCFLCTLGADKPVPEYEQAFKKIIESFDIKK